MSNSKFGKKGGKNENKQEKVSGYVTSKFEITLHSILQKIISILSVNQTKESNINRFIIHNLINRGLGHFIK